MTKEQFLKKWGWSPSEVHNEFAKDFDGVIAHEIAKVQEVKPQPAKPFDRERFEAMFRAVVASGKYVRMEFDKTAEELTKLDAYYATKEGGDNG